MIISFLSKSLLFSLLVLLNFGSAVSPSPILVTGTNSAKSSIHANLPTLQEFAAGLPSGSSQLVGLYSVSFAYPVLQQPQGSPGFVSTEPEKVTQFALASQYGSTGLLAHNYLAGAAFSEITTGETLTLVYGDGRILNYKVTAVEHYQALTPTSPSSNFLPVDKPGTKLTASDLFNHIYKTPGRLVLQTCIKANGNSSWGRLFIIAEPDPIPTALASFADWLIGTNISVN
jgi:hypothetical protein